MKYIHILKKSSLFLISGLLLASCQDLTTYGDIKKDQETSTGAPVIEKIMLVDRSAAITEGELSQVILVKGSNLSGVKSIKMNDVEVDLGEGAYITSKEISVQIPRKIPIEINDKLTVITNLGETSADFKVNIPPLVVNGLLNEFSLPGDTTSITGKNFDLYELDTIGAVVKLGDLPVEVIKSDKESMTVWIPANANLDQQDISISSPVIPDPIIRRYREPGYSMNANGVFRDNNQVKKADIGPKDVPLLVGESYGHIHPAETIPAWGWWEHQYGFNFNFDKDPVRAEELALDIVANLDQYDMKFEICTEISHPLAGNFIFRLHWGNRMSWMNNSQFNTYGKWQTVTVNAKEALDPMYVDNSHERYFTIVYQPSTVTTHDFYLCNFRFVKRGETSSKQ